MGLMFKDEKQWYEAWLNTPLTFPRGLSEHEAFKTPGCCVKSQEKDSDGRWPVMTGILVSYNEERDEIVVRGHGDTVSPKFVWKGTRREYVRVWRCD